MKPSALLLFWKKMGILLLLIVLFGCNAPLPQNISQIFPSINAADTPTAFQPVAATRTALPVNTATVLPSATSIPEAKVWINEAAPPALIKAIRLPENARLVTSSAEANVELCPLCNQNGLQADWIYAVVAPFPTLEDTVTLADLKKTWYGEPSTPFNGKPLLVSASTQAALTALWGKPAATGVEIHKDDELLDAAWNSRPSFGIVPFENLDPRWKVLSVDGLSPLEKSLDVKTYPLLLHFGFHGDPIITARLANNVNQNEMTLPATNRDTQKMTTLVMTGTTALTRAVAYKMDNKGVTYPASDIHDWLYNADLLHISNESSFAKNCPMGDVNNYGSLMFCSRPEYIGLLDYIGADIIELSGNHNNDWGRDAFTNSLDLYQQRGWLVYAGGANLEEARLPRTIERNGNRFAFIGCNPAGPDFTWATKTEAGVASCNYTWMAQTVRDLRSQGFIPIVTFQYFEHYIFPPTEQQQADFRRMTDAGAAIVSGSQSHYPQTMEFYNNGFIHYGLGNLFFDQMDIPVIGTRREFIDRHVFYDGRHISTELLTAMLEDYSRPRPMTPEERTALLTDIFKAAGW